MDDSKTTYMAKVFFYDEECVEGVECEKCGWTEIWCHDDTMPEYCPQCERKVEYGD